MSASQPYIPTSLSSASALSTYPLISPVPSPLPVTHSNFQSPSSFSSPLNSPLFSPTSTHKTLTSKPSPLLLPLQPLLQHLSSHSNYSNSSPDSSSRNFALTVLPAIQISQPVLVRVFRVLHSGFRRGGEGL
jgi:hypothetical protein